jgi:NADPH:quinone reductase-like Zn-dependent oxidoreductase
LKAVVQHRYGRAQEVLSLREVEKPVPRDNEVLVRVRASALHPDVWHAVAGSPLIFRLMGAGMRRPKQSIPGMDVAGSVESVGRNVTRFKPGDEVFGVTLFMRLGNGGAFAEFAAVREDLLANKPSHVTFEQAATIPTPGVITLINLRPQRIEPHHHVLINGAGGNVGSLALQMAKARGARVTGVDSPQKLEMIRSLGADCVIDYTREDFTRGDERYDFILDVASTSSFAACKAVLAPGGRYWIVGHDHFGKATGRVFGSIPRMIFFMLSSNFRKGSEPDFKFPPPGDLMETLRRQLDAGELTPIVGKVFSFAEARIAMQCLEEGTTVGRIAIVPGA